MHLDVLHPAQRAFIDDPDKRRSALCGRRAGKSRVLGIWHYDAARDNPGSLSLCVARTKGNARRILWSQSLSEVNAQLKLGLTLKEEDGQLMVLVPTKGEPARIWLAGCQDRGEVDKFRGNKFLRASVDEAQSLDPILEELVEDVIDPALADLDGDLALSGTPGVVPAGYFFEITTGDGGRKKWSTHHFTVRDNPYFRPKYGGGAKYLEELLGMRGWTPEHPTYRREWLGEWVTDGGALVFPYNAGRNCFFDEDMPHDGDWRFALGIDLGAGEEPTTAFVTAAYRRGHPEIWIVEAAMMAQGTPSKIAREIQRRRAERRLEVIVIDEGALGKGYADEFRAEYCLPVEPAQKLHKRAYIELVGGNMLTGQIRIHRFKARPLIDEISVLPWDEERKEPDSRYADHAAHAFLYVCRAIHPMYRPELSPPTPGSVEWHEQERIARRKAAQKKARDQAKGKGLWVKR
jgi:hypothetical protein